MKFKCEIDNLKTLKKGMKITLAIDDENTINVMKDIYNFMDKPLEVELLIDSVEEVERLKQITPDQRKKIYATMRDIADYIGEDPESTKHNLKRDFLSGSEYDEFSLSNCSNELASDFIEYLLNFALENGVPLKEHPLKRVDDVDRYLLACIRHRVCCVCGRPAEIHHVDAIGMGRDRKTYDDSEHKKMALCRQHHTEAHQIGVDTFNRKYHVYGVIVDV